MPFVDLHTHVIPRPFIERVASGAAALQARIERPPDGPEVIVHQQGYRYPLFEEFFDVGAKLARMDAHGIRASFLSPAPPLFYYWAEPATGAEVARLVNDAVAAMAAEAPERLRGVATVPLQDVALAVAELERAVATHGFRMVEVGTSVEGVLLSDPRFRPFLRRAAELDVAVFAHPYYVGDTQGLEPYYLTNLIGNPYDTCLLAAHLMFGGVLDELPELRVLLAHGGGFLPYQLGRLEHGYAVRQEPRSRDASPPGSLVRRFYFDTLTFSPRALGFLIGLVGADRVVIGTDTPFDMGDARPVQTLGGVPGLSAAQRADVEHRTSAALTGWEPGR